MKLYCTHYACRCARANELAYMAELLGRDDLLWAALAAHESEVRCSMDDAKPRPSLTRGQPLAPLP